MGGGRGGLESGYQSAAGLGEVGRGLYDDIADGNGDGNGGANGGGNGGANGYGSNGELSRRFPAPSVLQPISRKSRNDEDMLELNDLCGIPTQFNRRALRGTIAGIWDEMQR